MKKMFFVLMAMLFSMTGTAFAGATGKTAIDITDTTENTEAKNEKDEGDTQEYNWSSFVEKYKEESLETQVIVFEKSRMLVSVFTNGELSNTFSATSGAVAGDKEVEGDSKTPVGRFYVAQKLPNSAYTKALLVSYPNIEDADRGLSQGLIDANTYSRIVAANQTKTTPPQDTALGGMIEFHGNGQPVNATRGCIGLKDYDMIQLYNMALPGATIDILI